MAEINEVSITAANQWWSDTKGVKAPRWIRGTLEEARLSFWIVGALANGTIVTVRRRVIAALNGGTAGSWRTVVRISATQASANSGYIVDLTGLASEFEYDIGVATAEFGAGDTVSVGMI